MPPQFPKQKIYLDTGRPDELLTEQETGQLRVAEWVWRQRDINPEIRVIPVIKLKDGTRERERADN